MSPLPFAWAVLAAQINGTAFVGMPGARDPEHPCEDFTATGYDGSGTCRSDGHYLCVECHHLAPDAPRFEEFGREGRGDRLRLFWHRPQGPIARLRTSTAQTQTDTKGEGQ